MSRLIDAITPRIERAVAEQMERLKATVVERLSVPVVRQGSKVIRSKPGEPPRKDTGRLVLSAAAQTIDATRSVKGSVSVSTPYARRLVREMNRPIFGPVLRDAKPAILAAIRAAITSK